MKPTRFAFWAGLGLLLVLGVWPGANALGQCSSLYTTPEFPIATHPSDGHTQSWGANIFTPAQWGAGAASVTGLQIYVDNSFGPTTYTNQTVWLRHTAVSSYPNALYPTTAGFTQCFTGTYSFPMSGLYTIAFNVSPFAYNGSQNVEVLFENRSNVYRANEPWFRRTTSYGAGVYRSKWNGNFGFGGFPGTASDGSAVRLTYTLSLTAAGAGGCGAILNVDFPDFQALPDGDKVVCAWQVSEDLASLVLERSSGDAHFEAMASFEGNAGTFQWQDPAPHSGVNLYRLRGMDVDGGEHLSAMALVDMADPGSMHLSASPSQDGIDVVLDAPKAATGTLIVHDLMGRRIWENEQTVEAGRSHLSLPIHAAGIWIVEWIGEGQREAVRVVR